MRFPLTQSASAVADSDGVAIATIGPDYAYEKWHITSVAVQSTSTTLVPEVREYKGAVGGNLLGTSRTGDADSGSADIHLMPGDILSYKWSNCDVGATCTVTVNGERERP